MNYLGSYLTTSIFLVVYLVVMWVVVDLMHLQGQKEYLARTLLLGLGFALFGAFHVWRNDRQRRRAAAGTAPAGQPGADDLDYLFRQAESKLSASALGKDANLGTLPAFFLLGDNGSAKTSIFVNSGVEPDLLAGQVYQENAVVPTRPANIWLAQQAVFVECGGRLLAEHGRWSEVVKKLKPARLRRIFGRKPAPPRAAVVCVDCERFLQANAEESLRLIARSLNARLGEISQALGSALPVYVLFTKMDRVRHFAEFVSNLSDQEARQVLGATLPFRTAASEGVYAEAEAKRVSGSFNELFHSLCEKRLSFLLREHDPANANPIYEFPREFRKLRGTLVSFLVELGRPSQLHANPFLRGFYFSGVRPVTLKEHAPLARAQQGFGAEGSGVFNLDDDMQASAPAAVSTAPMRTRRVPQWIFLSQLFGDLILKDGPALSASGQSVGRQQARRTLLASTCALLMLLSLAWTISFFRNRALEAWVVETARGIAKTESGGAGQQLPSQDALARLDTLRQSVGMLSLYAREGAPWTLRWGLYVGDQMYPLVRRLYFSRFHQLLFGATQAALVGHLRGLPEHPGPSDPYRPSYDTLKAYLITTSHSEKSTRSFLSPFLFQRWLAERPLDNERRGLASSQFDFYSDELLSGNPFSREADEETVEHARTYLARFNATESIYQFVLAEAARQKPPVNFNKQFPGSSSYVVNNKEVSGAFTADGWAFVQDALKNLKRFFGGERWVLGDKAYDDLDPGKIAPELNQRYHKDVIGAWRDYLAASQVTRYGSLPDAASKLAQLSSNQSYLLAMFCVAATNTATVAEDVKQVLQPIHYITPPGCMDRYISNNNSPYMSALVGLQTSIDRVSKMSGELRPDAAQQTLDEAANAFKVTRQTAQNFRIDREANTHGLTQKLMEDPIKYVEALLGRLGPAQLNTEGRRFCGDFRELASKYPFRTASKVDASLAEINAMFRPGEGKLAAFYESTLKNYIDRRGREFVRKPDSRAQINEAYLRFLNRAAALSDALYAGGRTDPRLSYVMTALPAEGLKSVTLSLDGQALKASAHGGDKKDFTWPGSGAQGARLAGNMGGSDFSFITYEGLWAAFRFFGDADSFRASGNNYVLQWVPRQGQSAQPIRLDNGKTLTLPFELDLKGVPPIFQKGYLSGLECVSDIAR